MALVPAILTFKSIPSSQHQANDPDLETLPESPVAHGAAETQTVEESFESAANQTALPITSTQHDSYKTPKRSGVIGFNRIDQANSVAKSLTPQITDFTLVMGKHVGNIRASKRLLIEPTSTQPTKKRQTADAKSEKVLRKLLSKILLNGEGDRIDDICSKTWTIEEKIVVPTVKAKKMVAKLLLTLRASDFPFVDYFTLDAITQLDSLITFCNTWFIEIVSFICTHSIHFFLLNFKNKLEVISLILYDFDSAQKKASGDFVCNLDDHARSDICVPYSTDQDFLVFHSQPKARHGMILDFLLPKTLFGFLLSTMKHLKHT